MKMAQTLTFWLAQQFLLKAGHVIHIIITHLPFVSYRTQLDALTDERDKLKGDIYEANQRNALLVKEVDESHANILKTNEAKLQ